MVFPEVVIIIVNYNQIGLTLECIYSLLDAGADLNQIIVVDNNSMDNSIETLKKTFSDSLAVIGLDDNKGYPYALNKGIPVALQRGAEWLLLMNNDVIVDKDFIIELKDATREKKEARLIGPTILYYDHPEIIWYIGEIIVPGTLIGVRSFRGRKYDKSIPKFVDIDFVHGCTMMVNKSVFEKIGLFEDSDIIYGDDADFSYRARKAGFKMIAATRAKMWHKISMTMRKQEPRTRYLRTRNTIAFYKKYTKGMKRLIMFSFTFLKSIIMLIKDIFSGQLFMIWPQILGFVDGWRGEQKDRVFS